MSCCQCEGIENEFNDRLAARELERFRRRGPIRSTRLLVDALRSAGTAGATLLDIGGGIGAIQHALLDAGVRDATQVDASASYIAASRDETARRGHAGRVTYVHGDFVQLAPEIPDADVVTLDRVICCYHDMPALVGAAADHARRSFGAVYPRGTPWIRLGIRAINLMMRLRRSPFRTFAHPPSAIDAVLTAHGMQRTTRQRTLVWEIATYRRA